MIAEKNEPKLEKGVSQIKVPLNLASRRGDASAVVRQFRILAKRTAKTFRMVQ
jgi:hypothetical protein